MSTKKKASLTMANALDDALAGPITESKTKAAKNTENPATKKKVVRRKSAPKKTPAFNMKEFGEKIAKSYKHARVTTGEDIKEGWDKMPTPSIMMNHKLAGGLAVGGLNVIEGPEGTGKTSLALHIIAEDQRRHKDSWWLIANVERSIDKLFLRRKGCDTERIVIIDALQGEDYGDIIAEYLATGQFRGLLLDSMAALVPKQVMEGSETKYNVAGLARLLSRHLPKVNPYLDTFNVTAIYTNHIKEKPGVMFGSPEYAPGGSAPRYYSLTLMRLSRLKNTQYGHLIGVQIMRNKPAGGYEKDRFYVPLRHAGGVDVVDEVYTMAKMEEFGLIEGVGKIALKDGSEVNMGRSKDACLEFLRDNPEVFEDLRDQTVAILDLQPLAFVENGDVELIEVEENTLLDED